ncbi:MAG TPA: hypothetical protein DC006_05645 [Prevotellaceae bacterium]|nr:hypothetical protein [Prevotellaceae bacterium]
MEYNKKTGKWESKYWHPTLTTDAMVFEFDKEDGSLQVPLIKRGKAKPGEIPTFEGYWATPGGFVLKNMLSGSCGFINKNNINNYVLNRE